VPSRWSHCKCCKMLIFPCPTSWIADIDKMKSLQLHHCQSMYCIITVTKICMKAIEQVELLLSVEMVCSEQESGHRVLSLNRDCLILSAHWGSYLVIAGKGQVPMPCHHPAVSQIQYQWGWHRMWLHPIVLMWNSVSVSLCLLKVLLSLPGWKCICFVLQYNKACFV